MYPKITVSGNFFSTSNCQCNLFSNKSPFTQIFCLSGRLAVSINPDKWSSTVLDTQTSDLCVWTVSVIRYVECCVFCLILARQPPVGQGFLILEVSRSHTTTHYIR